MNGIADYEFIRPLWHGNHGTFWLAKTPSRLATDEPQVAVKVLGQLATDDDFRRMTNELKIFAAVRSEFLIDLYDAGHQDGRLYYSSQYLADGSLAAPKEKLDRTAVVRAVADAAHAAHALHEAGVAHRDIKPSNILLTKGRGRLTDLGLAQVLNPGQTVTGVGPIGAVEYLAPEVVKGETATRWSDVWALGATLHHALCGRSAYPGLPDGSLIEALRHVMAATPVASDEIIEAERTVIERCFSADPVDRPATALELAHQLESVLNDEGGHDVR